jgi:hypothetical protein
MSNHSPISQGALDGAALENVLTEVLASTPFIDIHTHLFAPELGSLGLWGIDELLTYHYLEAELFRFNPMKPDAYWAMTKQQQADVIWKTLFVENPPLSEACRGVVAVMHLLGLDTNAPTLAGAREFFRAQNLPEYIGRVFQLAGISSAVMTNDILDPAEAPQWMKGGARDPRFHAALRLDRILNQFPAHAAALDSQGYKVDASGGGKSMAEIRRFLGDWVKRAEPVYMAVSLEDNFLYPLGDLRTKIFREAVLPACHDAGIPMSLMIGVRRQVNPAIRLAGDASGVADLRALENMCRDFPENRFLVSLLSRENQHELCVYARKFANMMPFGCWWFLNNPSLVEEITRERMEMLGPSFIPQHSDARILEQVIYKWRNTRRTMAPLLANTYRLLIEDGRNVTRQDVERDVKRLFRGNFETFVKA